MFLGKTILVVNEELGLFLASPLTREHGGNLVISGLHPKWLTTYYLSRTSKLVPFCGCAKESQKEAKVNFGARLPILTHTHLGVFFGSHLLLCFCRETKDNI